MPIVTPPPGRGDAYSGAVRRSPGGHPILALPALVVLLVAAGVGYWWFVQRVEVNAGEVLVLVRKVGAELPASPVEGKALPGAVDQQVVLYPSLLAALGEQPDSTHYKGILYEVKTEGRHFYDPFLWKRLKFPAQQVKDDESGVLIRRFGKPLPPGQIVATEPDERGPLAEMLRPGRYNLNPFAYDIRRVKPVVITAGNVGVQTLYSGKDPATANDYVVATGERGVQPDVLPPGMYYNNPYVRRIDAIDTRSHTIDMQGDDAIRFPSNDSFEILVDTTVEYAIRQDLAPYVMVAIGTHDDIKEKLILPYARSLCRIEGSKLFARDFIGGETRGAFQKRVFEGLKEQCYAQGIEVRSTLIRRIVPPNEIAGPISDRQVAGQQIMQYENEIKVADSEARLVEQQEMQKQNQAVGQANREVVSVVKEAEQGKSVAITQVNQRREVAKLNLEAARQTAAAILSRGQAEAEVALLRFTAEAQPLRDAVAAFGDGETYAQYFFYQKLGPAVKSVLASTDGPLADIFKSLSQAPPPGTAPPKPPPAREARGAAAAGSGAKPAEIGGQP